MPVRRYQINRHRFIKLIKEQGEIGWENDIGLQRIAFSDSYNKARDWLETKMRELGLETYVDGVGNLFGVLRGKNESIILTGSHLDSVKNGGILDGALGVIAGLESMVSLKETGYKPNNTFVVVAFIAEEGEPLGGTFGSRAFAGLLGESVEENKLSHYRITKNNIAESKAIFKRYKAYIELHIEQGPILERQNMSIGIPTGIVGITRFNVSVHGVANHAGTTPMQERKDAVRVAADIIHEWYRWMDTQNGLVCNIGTFTVSPGHVSIVPDKVSFCLELRSLNDLQVNEAVLTFKKILDSYPNCLSTMELVGSKPTVMLDSNIINIIRKVCAENNINFIEMSSGASHDASPIAHVMPSGMIFVPSKDGISHAKNEFTADSDLICGAEVLLNSLLALDKI